MSIAISEAPPRRRVRFRDAAKVRAAEMGVELDDERHPDSSYEGMRGR